MSDPRPYIKVSNNIEDHPKISCLSSGSAWLLITTWCWCSRHLTDGKVPAKVFAKRGTARQRSELIRAGLVEVQPDGDVVMHDYQLHQMSGSEVRSLSTKRAEAGRKGGRQKQANRVAKQVANARDGATGLPSKSVPDVDVDKRTTTSAAPSAPRAGDSEGVTEPTENRVNRIARTYTDVVKLSNFLAVRGIVKKAVQADYTDDQVIGALGRLAEDHRPVTTETLRIEIEGLPLLNGRRPGPYRQATPWNGCA